MDPETRSRWERELDAFDAAARRAVLARLAADAAGALPPETGHVNMHVHSFFSFNAKGFSPSRIAWESRKRGLFAAALCDFDVLDGLEEFCEAGLLVGLRTSVHLETRAYLKEFATVDINSPGEPGVTYIMGAGFAEPPAGGSPQAAGLDGFRRRARERNLALVSRINTRLPAVAVDYERDVLPLTPAGVATERHLVRAYLRRSRDAFPRADQVAAFWAATTGKPLEEIVERLADPPAMEETARSALVKRGGIGYEAPTPKTFPPVEEFIGWVRSCGAIPMVTWLDGTSPGERDGRAMLECLRAKGAAALNIIPDRNWNVKDPKERAVKVAHLRAIVAAAESMAMPVNIGTEMNKTGQPLADDLDGEALREHREVFQRGAAIIVGHTLLLRYGGYGYGGPEATNEFEQNTVAKNRFFEAAGRLPPLTRPLAAELRSMGRSRALTALRDSIRAGRWSVHA